MLDRTTQSAVRSLEQGRWGPLASLIQDMHQSRAWEGSFKNFTSWMAHLTEAHGVSKARIWRYKAVGAYYNELATRFNDRPQLTDLPTYVSAEQLELLQRIEKTAPNADLIEIILRVLDGDMPMRELRAIWNAYKKAHDGSAPQAMAAAKQFDADCGVALAQQTDWAGNSKPQRLHVITGGIDASTANRTREFDAVALVQRSLREPIEIHCFEFKLCPKNDSHTRRWDWNHEGDFMWAISNSAQFLKHLEPQIGLMVLTNGKLEIERQPQQQDPTQALSSFGKGMILAALRV